MKEIARFAEFVRNDPSAIETLGKVTQVSEVASFAGQLGYAVSEDELKEFLDENRKFAPQDVIDSISSSGGKIDFSEESIVLFSKKRLQIDTDY